MPRKRRFYLPGIPAHIVQRGNNRQAVFFDEQDYLAYLDYLKGAALTHGCAVHAYVLMTNHVHLLVTPRNQGSISLMVQKVGRNYVTYVNHKYGRSGPLWEGRHKGCAVAEDGYFVACSRYIELNPVRAGMVKHPGAYRWSSYRCNAVGEVNTLLSPHGLYQALGRTTQERAQNYRQLFSAAVEPAELDDIRASVQTGTPLGNDRFRAEIESMLNCKVGQSRRGRPSLRVLTP